MRVALLRPTVVADDLTQSCPRHGLRNPWAVDKAADRAGLNAEGMQRLSFHDLRHTAITHLIRSGADAAQVSRFAGHSKVSTTLDLYVGEFEKRKVNDSGQRLAEVYAGAV
jgi:integrase